MTDYKSLWWEKMLAIHGSEEAVREFMSNSAKKKTTKTGFTSETAKLAGAKGATNRWSKANLKEE